MVESIGSYLIRRLREEGVGHVFGVPGDYVLTFFNQIENSAIKIINTCDEQGAGFAADAYARLKGLGAVCITYCVGGLKIANAAAQAYAERSPMVIISGAPGVRERRRNPLLHHKVRAFDTQQKVLAELTAGTAVLDDPERAAGEIDRVLALVRTTSRPVYIELPRDMVLAQVIPAKKDPALAEASDAETLSVAVSEAAERIAAVRHPVILAGEELHRFRLQEPLAELVHKTGIPIAATIMGKSVFPESDPAYIGVYEGAMGREGTRDYVEKSDCIILLGALMTDISLGIYTARIDRCYAIYAAKDRVSVGLHSYDDIDMEDFIRGLASRSWQAREFDGWEHPTHPGPYNAADKPITVTALFRQINAFINKDMIVIADPGDALFGAEDLYIQDGAHFLGPAYYCSLGFAVPAALGVQFAEPNLRPLVLVGDGAFQMSGMELSSIARYGQNPIIVVLDNDGYGTERPMLDGNFNDVHRWEYANIPALLNAGLGLKVKTEIEMGAALARALGNTASFTLIQVMLERGDHSPALARLTKTLAERVAKKA